MVVGWCGCRFAPLSVSPRVWLCPRRHLRGALAELNLAAWAMGLLRGEGFQLQLPPDLVHTEVVSACGFHARGAHSQVYDVQHTDLCLIGTSEIPLASWCMQQILPEQQLPLRLAAFSHCFRREAGSGGTQDAGLYRLHQFSKVEMFVVCAPEDSEVCGVSSQCVCACVSVCPRVELTASPCALCRRN